MRIRVIKKIIILFLCIIVGQSTLLSKDFDILDTCGDELKPVDDDDPRYKMITDSMERAQRVAKYCLPKSFYDQIDEDLDSRKIKIFVECVDNIDGTDACASVKGSDRTMKGVWMRLPRTFFTGTENGCCLCKQATMLHELLHWSGIYHPTGGNDDHEVGAWSCELKCFGNDTICLLPHCIPDKYKGRANPKYCCEKK